MSHSHYKSLLFTGIAMALGLLCAGLNIPQIDHVAGVVATLFIKFLQLISMPIIFLAIASTLLDMDSLNDLRWLGKKVLKYTLATTFIAALIAFVLYNIFQPAAGIVAHGASATIETGYFDTVLKLFPDNLLKAFIDNNVLGVAFIAGLFGTAMLTLEEQDRKPVASFFSGAFKGFLQIATLLVKSLPIAVWAFTLQFAESLVTGDLSMDTIGRFVLCVVLANLIQGFIVLPVLLRMKGISPLAYLRSVSPAVITAGMSKSSSAALPLTLKCVERSNVTDEKVSRFSLPLCTVINMNGCAAFIFTAVLFVSMSNGVVFTVSDMVMWTFLATIAAVGNASVPMGCYFLASAFLVGMGQPLEMMGLILPVYALIDMLETALNVWSDCVVTAAVGVDVKAQAPEGLEPTEAVSQA